MIDITKDKLFQNRLEKITKLKIKNTKTGTAFRQNKMLTFLIATFGILAITNGILVYNFFKILGKL